MGGHVEREFHRAVKALGIGVFATCHLLEAAARKHDQADGALVQFHMPVLAVPVGLEAHDVAVKPHHPLVVGGEKPDSVEIQFALHNI